MEEQPARGRPDRRLHRIEPGVIFFHRLAGSAKVRPWLTLWVDRVSRPGNPIGCFAAMSSKQYPGSIALHAHDFVAPLVCTQSLVGLEAMGVVKFWSVPQERVDYVRKRLKHALDL